MELQGRRRVRNGLVANRCRHGRSVRTVRTTNGTDRRQRGRFAQIGCPQRGHPARLRLLRRSPPAAGGRPHRSAGGGTHHRSHAPTGPAAVRLHHQLAPGRGKRRDRDTHRHDGSDLHRRVAGGAFVRRGQGEDPMRLMSAAVMTAMLAATAAVSVRAEVLDDENRRTITLGDGTSVTLIGEAGSDPAVKSKRFYYLPVNLRLAKRADGTPEFLFLKYTSEATTGASGGLIHFLVEWGLTPAQETELTTKLRAQITDAVVAGPVQLQSAGDTGTFRIVSGTLDDKTLAASVVTSGSAPLVAGGRAAAAARLTADGAQLLAATFEKARSITDLSLALNYGYVTLAPAARGTITYDWSRLEREGKTLRAEYTRTQTGTTETEDCFMVFCSSSSTPEYAYSYEEMRNQYKFLEEKEIVKIHFDELVADERVAKIREAFFQYFLNTMAKEKNDDQTPPPPASAQEKEKSPDARQGSRYHFVQSSFTSAFATRSKRISLDYRMAVRWPFQLVGNLASWYQGVRDNPKCVASVNL